MPFNKITKPNQNMKNFSNKIKKQKEESKLSKHGKQRE